MKLVQQSCRSYQLGFKC